MEKQTKTNPNLVFIKLGGSLITDKGKPRTPCKGVIIRLAEEIKTLLENNNELELLLGHGSGSFGHVPAKKYGTAQGVKTLEEWRGFTEVWFEARLLNQIVMESFQEVGLPAVSFPVSASGTASGRKIHTWDLTQIRFALEYKLIPVVYGDVIFDTILGGTIVSTEDIFTYAARKLSPGRILLAGKDEGVYSDYPNCTQLIPEITNDNWTHVADYFGKSKVDDVTGGMRSKVQTMLKLTLDVPGLEAVIFSGVKQGNLSSVIKGEDLGTKVSQGNR